MGVFRLGLLIVLIALLAGCAERGTTDSDDTGADVAAEQTPTPEPTPTDEAVATDPEDDPRELLFDLHDAAQEENFEFVYDNLASRFHIVEFDEQWFRGLSPQIGFIGHFAGESVDLEAFSVEDHGSFAVVRSDDAPPFAFVFRVEDGEWRYDPGDAHLVSVAHQSLPEDQRGEHPWNVPHDTQWDFDGVGEIFAPVRQSVRTVAIHNGSADVTLHWDFEVVRVMGDLRDQVDEHLRHDAVVPLDSIRWHAGDESGPVEITWANAMLTDDELRFPGWGDLDVEELSDGQQERLPHASFSATFHLSDIPDDVDEIIVQVEGLQIGPMGEDSPVGAEEPISMMIESYIPAETSSGVLIGEPPDYDPAAEIDDAPTPVPHEELPDGPELADRLNLIEVEYERDGDAVDVTAYFERDDLMIEIVGPDSSAIWTDGEEGEVHLALEDQIEISTTRIDAPSDAEIESITLREVAWKFDGNADGTFHEDRIETEWGDFPIMNIVDEADDRATVHYQPAGRRYIANLQIDPDGERIGVGAGSHRFSEDFVPERGSLSTTPGFQDVREDLPLPASVEIWQSDQSVSVEIGQ